MIEKLTPEQIEGVLTKTLIGRIGCHADGETYVVPISFVYKDKAIYCYTNEGKKTAMMRKNPSVCFQTDKMSEMGNWQSVVVQGAFEELTAKEEKSRALRLLLNRHLPFVTSVRSQIGLNWPFHPDEEEEIEGVLFRIAITEMSGRFETYVYLPNFWAEVLAFKKNRMKAERIAGKTIADGYASAREPVSVAMACAVNVRFGKLQ